MASILLDVISNEEGWTVELDLPEANVNYVLDEQQQSPCRCTFRLRSDPTTTYDGIVEKIADVAHINPTGKSMVRVTLTLKPDVRHGLSHRCDRHRSNSLR